MTSNMVSCAFVAVAASVSEEFVAAASVHASVAVVAEVVVVVVFVVGLAGWDQLVAFLVVVVVGWDQLVVSLVVVFG